LKSPLRVVFMGTPDFAVPSLKALAAERELVDLVAVYTQPDRPAGRGQNLKKSAVKLAAEDLGIQVFQSENINLPEEVRRLADHLADVVVVVAYAQFLGAAILNTPRLGCLNVHSSLLPKFRGAAPIQFAIWTGEKESGVTIMRLVRKMDAGPILMQEKLAIPDTMTARELHDQLAILGAQALVKTLEGLRSGTVNEVEQNESQATYAALIRKEDGLLDFSKSGVELLRQIRALNPWPGVFYKSRRGILKVHRARFENQLKQFGTGENISANVAIFGGQLFLRCSDGWIEVLEIQPEGKKAMTTAEFLNGVRSSEELEII